MEQETLATEIFKELKLSAKRWFIAFIVMLFLELATIGGFLWYISLPIDSSTVDVTNDEGTANYIGGNMSGGVFNGQNKSNESQTSSEE